jgi:hypothetical protein
MQKSDPDYLADKEWKQIVPLHLPLGCRKKIHSFLQRDAQCDFLSSENGLRVTTVPL